MENIRGESEIANLAGGFNQLLDRLNGSFKREREFIGDMAHEMKTPLTTLKSRIEVALSKPRSNDEYRNEFTESLVEINRMVSTLENVLSLAWAESDHAKFQQNPLQLSNFIQELTEQIKKLAQQKNLKIIKEVEPELTCNADKEQLKRAILNILGNAIKYTPSNGTVKIKLSRDRADIILEISDTGVGIATEDIPHIFDRFYRGAKTSKAFGSGLGLSIAKSIVEKHGGKITVKSVVNQGSAFTVILPIS